MTPMVSDTVINMIVGTIGTVATAWIAHKSKIIEVLGSRRRKDDAERITTEEVRAAGAADAIERSGVVEEMREQLAWMASRIDTLQSEVTALRQAQSDDAKRLTELTGAVYWYDSYVSALLAHIEAGNPPPPPALPKQLADIQKRVSGS